MEKRGLPVAAYCAAIIAPDVADLFHRLIWTWHARAFPKFDGAIWFTLPFAAAFLGQTIFSPAVLSGLFTAVLGFGPFTAIAVAIRGDEFLRHFDRRPTVGVV